MFGSPPKFKLPFASDSRRNSLEHSIWAPLPAETALQSLDPHPQPAFPQPPQTHQNAPQNQNFLQNQNYPQNNPQTPQSRVHIPGADLLPPNTDFSHYAHYPQNPRTEPWHRPHFNLDPQHLAALPGFAPFYSYEGQGSREPDHVPHLAPGLWPDLPQKLPVWGPARRHSIGDVFPQPFWNSRLSGSFSQPTNSNSQNLTSGQVHTSGSQPMQMSSQSVHNPSSQNANLTSQPSLQPNSQSVSPEVHEYFSSDPHQRVKVTADYLAQRYFDEEKYLSDSYQLPKFPVESLLAEHHLVLVAFKAGRIDVFYLPPALDDKSVDEGALVMVEADRGRDLGKIVKMNISIDEARLLKLLQFLEQQAALCDTAMGDLLVRQLQSLGANSDTSPTGLPRNTSTGVAPPTLHFPKPIIGLASHNEAMQILNKKQDEEKACRLCLAKIASTSNMLSNSDKSLALLSLSDLMQMKLVDAEYQFDRKKLIFYYSTSRRIDFRDLVRELFRIYKTRIWMCAVNGIPYVPQHRRKLGPNLALNQNLTLGQGQNLGLGQHLGPAQSQPPGPAFGQEQTQGLRQNLALGQGQNLAQAHSQTQSQGQGQGQGQETFGELLVLKSLVDTLNR